MENNIIQEGLSMFWMGMLVGMIVVLLVLAVLAVLVWRGLLGVKSSDEFDAIWDSLVYACVNRDSTIAIVPHDVNLEVKEVLLEKK